MRLFDRIRALGAIFAALVLVCAFSDAAFSQDQKCVQPERLEQIKRQLLADPPPPPAEDKTLQAELVTAARDFSASDRKATIDRRGDAAADAELQKLKQENLNRVCSILNGHGWPLRSAVGAEGSAAFLFLITKALPVKTQIELYPLVNEAFNRGEVERGELIASFIDRLRLAVGQKQLFGSQVYVRDGFLVMAPIEQPARVDIRRAEFRMQPLRSYERFLEITYLMPLVRSVMEPVGTEQPNASQNAALKTPAMVGDAGEKAVVNIETAFVRMDVVVPDAASANATALEKSDFRVFENDKPVEIETFAKAEAPFDIVLLLDLSGSTADQVGLIRKTTRRFIEMKRPNDRIAIVVFHDSQSVVSELESDKEKLLKSLKDIDGRGASRIWEAVKFGLDYLDQKSEQGRRRAIVLMSDGADSSLTYYPRIGSRTGFADLVEAIQHGSTAIFPIYLDTEGPDAEAKKVYADARRTLQYMADHSAGNMYYAKKIDDLSTVYDRVLRDVGTVYTLGFTPSDENGTEKWRTLRVEVPSRPGLKIKHRPGYFVK